MRAGFHSDEGGGAWPHALSRPPRSLHLVSVPEWRRDYIAVFSCFSSPFLPATTPRCLCTMLLIPHPIPPLSTRLGYPPPTSP